MGDGLSDLKRQVDMQDAMKRGYLAGFVQHHHNFHKSSKASKT